MNCNVFWSETSFTAIYDTVWNQEESLSFLQRCKNVYSEMRIRRAPFDRVTKDIVALDD